MKRKTYLFILTLITLYSCQQHKPDNLQDTVSDSQEVEVPAEEEETPLDQEWVPLPDLRIISSSVDPQGLVAPQTKCKFKIKVKNIGQADYNNTIMVGGPGIGGGFNALKVGETKEVVVDYTPVSKNATYRLQFTVDPDNVIKESDETNNQSQTFVIKTTF